MMYRTKARGMDLVMTGAKLRKLRRNHQLSQDDLVDRLWDMGVPISKNSVSSWETGKKRPSVDHLLALRDLYGCMLDELVVCHRCPRDIDDRDQLVPFLLSAPEPSGAGFFCGFFWKKAGL